LLICDGFCFNAFHVKCVGLSAPPDTPKWFCDECKRKQKQRLARLQSLYMYKNAPSSSSSLLPSFISSPHQLLASINASGRGLSVVPSPASSLLASKDPSIVNVKSSINIANFSSTGLNVNSSVLNFFGQYQTKFGDGIPLNAPSANQPLFTSQLLEREKQPTSSFSHLQTGDSLSKQLKQTRRRIEEMIRLNDMQYDPVYCFWRPKSKQDFVTKVNKLYDSVQEEEKKTNQTLQ